MVPHGGARDGSGRKKKDGVMVSALVSRDVRELWKATAKVQGASLTDVMEAALLEYAKKHKVTVERTEAEA